MWSSAACRRPTACRHAQSGVPDRAQQPAARPSRPGPAADQRALGHDAVQSGTVAELFVTNVLNGTVAAARRSLSPARSCGSPDPRPRHGSRLVTSTRVVARVRRAHRPDALVIGPTGVGLGAHGTLYVADTVDNRIAAIPDAMTRNAVLGGGQTVSGGHSLKGPLGLADRPERGCPDRQRRRREPRRDDAGRATRWRIAKLNPLNGRRRSVRLARDARRRRRLLRRRRRQRPEVVRAGVATARWAGRFESEPVASTS